MTLFNNKSSSGIMSISYRKRRDIFTIVFTTNFLKIITAVSPWDKLQFNAAHLPGISGEKKFVDHIIHTGRGEGVNWREGRGALVYKRSRNTNMTDCISCL
jgi:hypothetical protein